MSAPIHFKGTDYDSVEAMSPHIRSAYEQSQRDKARNQESQADEKGSGEPAAQPQPAWGGPRPEGSVPAPAAFDAVSGLGPALEVHEETPGIQFLPNWGTPLARTVVRYQDGLACRTYKDKEILTLRWDDVAAILTNNNYHRNYTQCEYTLVRPGGEKLILDDSIARVQRLAAYIEQPVYERLGPPLAAAYGAGQPQTFGPVTVGRASGLTLGGTPYAWEAIQDVKVEYGRFKLTLRAGQKHETRANAIPNIELLCQLIGVKMISSDLAYI